VPVTTTKRSANSHRKPAAESAALVCVRFTKRILRLR
jgi:hypothetical protein